MTHKRNTPSLAGVGLLAPALAAGGAGPATAVATNNGSTSVEDVVVTAQF